MKGGDKVSNDKLFKTAIRQFLGDFLELVDPEIAVELDLSAPDFQPPEVFKDFQKHGHRVPDLVARVSTCGGKPRMVLIHVEVEGRFRRETEKRLRRYALHLELEFGIPVITVVVFLRGGPKKGIELRKVATVIGAREISSFSYVAFSLSRSLAEEYVNRPQPLAAALAALMRSRLWDRVEQKLFCLEAVSRARLPLAQEYVLAKVVESHVNLSPEEERRFEELMQERGEEVQVMAVTWEEALAERETKGKAEGLAEGLAEGKLTATRQAITLLAKHCFGSLPAGFEERLLEVDDLGRLHEILEQIPDVGAVQALDLSPKQVG